MEKAGWQEYEKVLVVNNDNGERLETYLIKGCRRKRGMLFKRGGSAQGIAPGHELIVMTFVMMEKDSARGKQSQRVFS
jgi:aspartate 1-decarboxylase